MCTGTFYSFCIILKNCVSYMETYSINRWYNITYEYLINVVYNRTCQPSCLNLSTVYNNLDVLSLHHILHKCLNVNGNTI